MSGENPGPTGLNGGRGKKSLSPNSSDTSTSSSPEGNNSSKKVVKKAKNEQKKDEKQEVIINPLNKQVINKVKQLKPEQMEKLKEFLDLEDKKQIENEMEFNDGGDSEDEEDDHGSISGQQNKDSEEVTALKEKYLKLELELEEVSQKLQHEGCYDSFKKQLGFIDMENSDQTDNLIDTNPLNKKIDVENKPQYKFIVKLKLNDIHFTDPTKVTRQIKEIKGNVNIENAFFNRFNKLLYLCTNDEASFKQLNSPWPANAFNKGAEIFKESPKEFKYFVAINGIDSNTRTEEDPDFIAICKAKGIFRLQRLIRKEMGTPLSTIKGYVNDKESYEHLIKTGLKYDFFSFKVTPWKFDKFQPIQCYICLKYGHNQKYCMSQIQKCLCCSGDHSFKDCPTKKSLKCINCNGAHAACSKQCPSNIKAALKKKNLMIAKATSQVTSTRPFNSMFRNESEAQSKNHATQSNTLNSNNNQLNNMLTQLIQLLSLMLTPNNNILPNNSSNNNQKSANISTSRSQHE